MTNSLFLRKVFKTLLSRNIKFFGNVYFGMVVRDQRKECQGNLNDDPTVKKTN